MTTFMVYLCVLAAVGSALLETVLTIYATALSSLLLLIQSNGYMKQNEEKGHKYTTESLSCVLSLCYGEISKFKYIITLRNYVLSRMGSRKQVRQCIVVDDDASMDNHHMIIIILLFILQY